MHSLFAEQGQLAKEDPVEENPAYIPLSHVPECKGASTQLGQLFLICSYALYGLVLECHTTPCPPPRLHQADHHCLLLSTPPGTLPSQTGHDCWPHTFPNRFLSLEPLGWISSPTFLSLELILTDSPVMFKMT